MLSMIETAVEITEGRVPGRVIGEIIAAGRSMLDHPIELMPHAREAVTTLAARHRVVLITKGDLLDQERKLAQSGLGDLFHGVEIVSEKTPVSYAAIFARHGAAPQAALMTGNSVKSDVLPVLEVGGWGVHVPHELVWDLDRAEAPQDHPRFRRIPDLGSLPGLVAGLDGHQPHLAPVAAGPARRGG
jgi:putative hydrolase of the HAD superfamily